MQRRQSWANPGRSCFGCKDRQEILSRESKCERHDPATLPKVPGLAQHQQAEALVYAQQGKAPATTLHIANEDRVKQAEQLLIQLQAEQGVYYL